MGEVTPDLVRAVGSVPEPVICILGMITVLLIGLLIVQTVSKSHQRKESEQKRIRDFEDRNSKQ